MSEPISKVHFVEIIDRNTDELVGNIPIEVPTGVDPSDVAAENEIISSLNKDLYFTRIKIKE